MTPVKFRRVQHVSIPIPPGGAEQARAFFGGALGLIEKQVPATLDASTLTWFSVGDDEHELHCFVDPEFESRATAAHFCFEVDDIEALRRRVSEAGIEFDHDPRRRLSRRRTELFVGPSIVELLDSSINPPITDSAITRCFHWRPMAINSSSPRTNKRPRAAAGDATMCVSS